MDHTRRSLAVVRRKLLVAVSIAKLFGRDLPPAVTRLDRVRFGRFRRGCLTRQFNHLTGIDRIYPQTLQRQATLPLFAARSVFGSAFGFMLA